MQKKILALVLRGASMGSKFLLIIGLSKVLTTEDYGVFSLIITTLTFLMFFLGLDFYNFSHREIIEKDHSKIQFLVNQFWFHLFCYILYIPIIYLIFGADIIPITYIFPFYLLLVFEHLGQELFRFFNLFNKPNIANLILLIRTGFWIVIILIFEYLIFNNTLTITSILYYWIGGSLLAIIFAIAYIISQKSVNLNDINFFKIDKNWIKAGIRISIPFFLGTIAYKVIEYSDRYMIDWFMGKAEVGVYSFFANFANIVNIVVNTITITLLVPNLLRAVSSEKEEEIKLKTKQFSRELYLTTLLVSLIIVGLIYPVLSWLDKPEFSAEIRVYFVILLANILFNASLIYHYLLYAYKRDKDILMPAVYASGTNILLNVIFIPIFGLIAAALSTLVSFGLILILKRKFWSKTKNLEML